MKIKQNKVSFNESDLKKIPNLPEQVTFHGKVGSWYILRHSECGKWSLTQDLDEMPKCWFWCLNSVLRMRGL